MVIRLLRQPGHRWRNKCPGASLSMQSWVLQKQVFFLRLLVLRPCCSFFCSLVFEFVAIRILLLVKLTYLFFLSCYGAELSGWLLAELHVSLLAAQPSQPGRVHVNDVTTQPPAILLPVSPPKHETSGSGGGGRKVSHWRVHGGFTLSLHDR